MCVSEVVASRGGVGDGGVVGKRRRREEAGVGGCREVERDAA